MFNVGLSSFKKKHLINEAVKFALALPQDLESTRYVAWVPPMLVSDVFPDGRSLVFINVLIQVSECVADIIHIAQIWSRLFKGWITLSTG